MRIERDIRRQLLLCRAQQEPARGAGEPLAVVVQEIRQHEVLHAQNPARDGFGQDGEHEALQAGFTGGHADDVGRAALQHRHARSVGGDVGEECHGRGAAADDDDVFVGVV